MSLDPETIDTLMQSALAVAKQAADAGEVPVGAVIWHAGKEIARGHNLVEQQKAVSRHAEVVALEAAAESIGDWRLNEAILCVTIEPCTMCTAAIKLARVGTVIFGAEDPSMGACGSIFDLMPDTRIGHVPRVISGVREEECAALMKNFFKERR